MPHTQAVSVPAQLKDAALDIQLRSVWYRQPVTQSLASLFPSLGGRHIEQALADAIMLLASAFSAGQEALSAITPNISAIVNRLRARHPGFSDESYRDVINFGCFLAR
jgi:hypothetical protein